MGLDKTWGETLPCHAIVLHKALEASFAEPVDLEQVAHWIQLDGVLVTHVIDTLADPSQSGVADDALLELLQACSVHQIRDALLCIAAQQLSISNHQRAEYYQHYWQQSVLTAKLAKALALLTGYEPISRCYVVGLLLNHGYLLMQEGELAIPGSAMLDENGQPVREQAALMADWAERRGWAPEWCDAIRYHHEPVSALYDAPSLIKLVNIAGALAETPDQLDINEIETLLGIQGSLLHELRQQLAAEMQRLAEQLQQEGDENHGYTMLAAGLRNGLQSLQWQRRIQEASNEQQLWLRLHESIRRITQLNNTRLFVRMGEEAMLECMGQNGYSLQLVPGRSRLGDIALHNSPEWQSITDAQHDLSIIDKQLLRSLGSGELACLPLYRQGEVLGLLVVAVSDELNLPLTNIAVGARFLLAAFCETRETLQQKLHQEAVFQHARYKKQREVLHEVNNPLTIVGNYLQTLRLKHSEDADLLEDIDRIRDELRRAAEILQKLGHESKQTESAESSISSIVSATTELIIEGMLGDRGIELVSDIDGVADNLQLPRLPVQQILTNLLKNAAEALSVGGVIKVTVKPLQGAAGNSYVTIDIEDNGPGLPAAVQANLFKAGYSSKPGHAGLGLQIVKQLVDELRGMIFCHSSSMGTHFQILLPVQDSKVANGTKVKLDQ